MRRVRLTSLGVESPHYGLDAQDGEPIQELFAHDPELPYRAPSWEELEGVSTGHQLHSTNTSDQLIHEIALDASSHRPMELDTSHRELVEHTDGDSVSSGFGNGGCIPEELRADNRRAVELIVDNQAPRPSLPASDTDQQLPQNSPRDQAFSYPSPRQDPSGHNLSSPSRYGAPEAILASARTESGLNNRNTQRQPVYSFYCGRFTSCQNSCACMCHSKSRYQSRGLLSKMMGSLLVGYTGLPISTSKCNLVTCKNHVSRAIRVLYTFPAWFVMKRLEVTFGDSSGRPSFGLSLRNRLDLSTGMNMLTSAINGDTAGIIHLLEEHKGSPLDVDIYMGQSAFAVCCSTSYCYQSSSTESWP